MRQLAIRLQAVPLTIALLAIMAVPAYAYSQITNYLTMNDYSLVSAQSIDVRARTLFEQVPFPPTIFESNFVTAINYNHLRSPSVYYNSGPNNSYVYRSSIGEIDNQPGYFWDQTGWFVGTATWEVDATFRAVTSCTRHSVRHFHGQTTKWLNSNGPDIYRTTTHASC